MGVLLPNAKPCQIGMIAEARAKTPPPTSRSSSNRKDVGQGFG